VLCSEIPVGTLHSASYMRTGRAVTGQSQSRRLKTTYSVTQMATMRTSAIS
jgi:hypothetical protein